MNVLKFLFESSLTEPNLLAESSGLSPIPEVKPLWANMSEIQATVTATIAPQVVGRVKFQGTRWRALSDRPYPLTEGTLVRVVGRQRTNILIVEPVG